MRQLSFLLARARGGCLRPPDIALTRRRRDWAARSLTIRSIARRGSAPAVAIPLAAIAVPLGAVVTIPLIAVVAVSVSGTTAVRVGVIAIVVAISVSGTTVIIIFVTGRRVIPIGVRTGAIIAGRIVLARG